MICLKAYITILGALTYVSEVFGTEDIDAWEDLKAIIISCRQVLHHHEYNLAEVERELDRATSYIEEAFDAMALHDEGGDLTSYLTDRLENPEEYYLNIRDCFSNAVNLWDRGFEFLGRKYGEPDLITKTQMELELLATEKAAKSLADEDTMAAQLEQLAAERAAAMLTGSRIPASNEWPTDARLNELTRLLGF